MEALNLTDPEAEQRETPAPTIAKTRHDLLTPINHVMGYSEMLAEELEAMGAQESVKRTLAIREEAAEILSLIHQAFPPGQSTLAPGVVLLLSVLDTHVNTLLEMTDAVTGAGDFDDASAIHSDLEKIREGAKGLRRVMPQLELLVASVGSINVSPRADNNEGERRRDLPSIRRHGVEGALVLVVDDDAANRDVLERRLLRDGYRVQVAAGGKAALDMISAGRFDLVLLDVMMPDLDGFHVLQKLRDDGLLADLPVIMVSALDEVQNVTRCIELGAEDYLNKPFDSILLRARIGASLEKKYLRDEERRRAIELKNALQRVEEERRRSEALLLNILPAQVSEELRATGKVTPKYFDDVTIVFTDFVGFTLSSENLAADELVELLHEHFTEFDRIVRRYGLEKLKTVGDSYMFIGGLPPRPPSHSVDAVLASIEILQSVERMKTDHAESWSVRIGVHTGPVIAGVVGIEKFAFDVWGETVNCSSRMESSGAPGRINMSERCYARIKDFFECEPRGEVLTKDERAVKMYFLKGIRPKLLQDLSAVPPPQFARRYKNYFGRDLRAFPILSGGGE